MEKPKVVIVMRRDLNMPKGKIGAQVGHVVRYVMRSKNPGTDEWDASDGTIVCLRAKSLAELFEIETQAKAAALYTHLVTDLGLTMFHGQPTVTCLGIGPTYVEDHEPVTGHLPLL